MRSSSFVATLAGALLALALFVAGNVAWGQASEQLPDIGTPANESLTPEDEFRIGLMIVKGLRDAGQIEEDPEVTEYIETVGARLASQAHDGSQHFQFFVVKDPRLNAFALPGGFIGVNAGLLLATANESELAGVLAHEIAHVTQRHIARRLMASKRTNIVTTAALLAAIILGATTGASPDVMQGAIAAAQGISAQQQINFTRSNEYEADRIGIGTLAAAGFDPNGVPSFFETMGRQAGLAGSSVPEFLQTHPLSGSRIAESRDRARQMRDVKVEPETLSYRLARERLRVLSAPQGTNASAWYSNLVSTIRKQDESHDYGRALSLMAADAPAEAVPILMRLTQKYPSVMQYRSALGQAQMQAGQQRESLQTFARALELFPRNVPVTVRYAESLLRAGQARRAHEILLDLFNNVPPTPNQARFIALAANTAGDVADAYSYMAEYHILSGDLVLAINQLQLALAVPQISDVQRARYEARLAEVREYVPKNRLPDEVRRERTGQQRPGTGTQRTR